MRPPLLDPNDAASIDIEHLKKMVDTFIERGFTYFDTAWMYCKFQSEIATKEVLVDRYPRDSYTLATKLHYAFIETKEDRDKVFNEQLKKTGVEFFDYYLIHDTNREGYEKYKKLDCFNWLKEKKEQGLVKKMGMSFHDTAEVLDQILTEQPDVEFVQLQINYVDWESVDVQSRKCYEVCVKHGKPVIVMEPVKGGKLAAVPEPVEKLFKEYHPDLSVASWAVRFPASLDNVFMVLSGMSNMEQLLDNTDFMDNVAPMNKEEYDILREAVKIISKNITVECTGCSYCTDGCPQNIAIPKYFEMYNEQKKLFRGQGWKPQKDNYLELTKTFGKASDCIECGQCEHICPQHLPIINHLKDIAIMWDK